MGKAPPFKPDRDDGRARTALVSCRLVPAGAEELNSLASKMRISRAELMRRALGDYVKRIGGRL